MNERALDLDKEAKNKHRCSSLIYLVMLVTFNQYHRKVFYKHALIILDDLVSSQTRLSKHLPRNRKRKESLVQH